MKLDTQSFRTYSAKPLEVPRKWYLVNAEGKTLGRLVSRIAAILRGKHKPQFTPHIDTGDFVVVINAEKVKLTGSKPQKKLYYHNTLYPGGARWEKFADILQRKPERIIEDAVWGMLPKNNLGRKIYKKLKVYAGPNHPHAAQKPEPLEIS